MPYSLSTALALRHNLSSARPVLNAGHWRVEKPDCDPFRGVEFELWHYSTRMIHWRESRRNGVELLSVSLGHGSVSDQQAMNVAFRAIGASHLYFTRKGGARIVNQETGETVYD